MDLVDKTDVTITIQSRGELVGTPPPLSLSLVTCVPTPQIGAVVGIVVAVALAVVVMAVCYARSRVKKAEGEKDHIARQAEHELGAMQAVGDLDMEMSSAPVFDLGQTGGDPEEMDRMRKRESALAKQNERLRKDNMRLKKDNARKELGSTNPLERPERSAPASNLTFDDL